ncbi:MAG: hypothetical protein MI974_28020 [Chitinophagales bacterium]|nr:hypothetical protein [Chitinophagales bacterium]
MKKSFFIFIGILFLFACNNPLEEKVRHSINIQVEGDTSVAIKGDDIHSIHLTESGMNILFSSSGVDKMEKLTSNNIGKKLIVKIKDEVISNPVIMETINTPEIQLPGITEEILNKALE